MKYIIVLPILIIGILIGFKLPHKEASQLIVCQQKLTVSNKVRELKTEQIDSLLLRITALKSGTASEAAQAWDDYKELGNKINEIK